MSTRTTKRTLIALERTDFVVAAIRTQKPTVTAALTQDFSASLPEGTPMPDWDALQDAQAFRLESSTREIRRFEQAYRQQLDRLQGDRRHRQTIVGRLISEYRRLRKSVAGNYPEGALTVLGVQEPPVRRYAAVREQMPEILARLRDPELLSRLPEPLTGHQPLDFESFAAPIETDIQAFDESMETIRKMHKILDEALLVKREALKSNRRIYLQLARIQEGYYRMAGLDELADRIRTEVFLLSPRRKEPAAPQIGETPTGETPAGETPAKAEETAVAA
jgi:hypothetical protein